MKARRIYTEIHKKLRFLVLTKKNRLRIKGLTKISKKSVSLKKVTKFKNNSKYIQHKSNKKPNKFTSTQTPIKSTLGINEADTALPSFIHLPVFEFRTGDRKLCRLQNFNKDAERNIGTRFHSNGQNSGSCMEQSVRESGI